MAINPARIRLGGVGGYRGRVRWRIGTACTWQTYSQPVIFSCNLWVSASSEWGLVGYPIDFLPGNRGSGFVPLAKRFKDR